jgi:hypothetical protein
MDWFEGMADLHIWAIIFAFAATILLPYALIAAQRPGRGIKPWWTTSRFLAIVAFIGCLFALASGEMLAKRLGLLNGEWILREDWTDMRLHQYLGGASVLFGYMCIRAAFKRRKEHEGLGAYTLFVGLAWALTVGGGGHIGVKMARARAAAAKVVAKEVPQASEQGDAPAQAGGRLMKVLDYASLVPMHQEPIRSPPHKNRWVRVWVSPNAVDEYTKGEALPEGSLAVMNSVEDRWGRPGFEPGPLYFLETLPSGKTRLGMYWSSVPESKRGEVDGLSRVNWVGANPGLASCAECHADGLAPIKTRGARARVAVPLASPASSTAAATPTAPRTAPTAPPATPPVAE